MPDKVSKKTKKKRSVSKCDFPTISLAIAGSILDNAQSAILQTYLAGQIARAATIFNVHEIVLFDDGYASKDSHKNRTTASGDSCRRLACILEYLECPQYLRKYLIPIQKELQFAGVLNPLDAPHHLRQTDEFPFREAVVLTKTAKSQNMCFVNAGLANDVLVEGRAAAGSRVTVQLDLVTLESTKPRGFLVPRSRPTHDTQTYWGYKVRIVDSLTQLFRKSVSDADQFVYDLIIGTSDKGDCLDTITFDAEYKHLLIVFGGLNGLEFAFRNDKSARKSTDDVRSWFDYYVNVLPEQGSRTIRTEEALLICLSKLLTPNVLRPFHA